jgi:hypothetical protein
MLLREDILPIRFLDGIVHLLVLRNDSVLFFSMGDVQAYLGVKSPFTMTEE